MAKKMLLGILLFCLLSSEESFGNSVFDVLGGGEKHVFKSNSLYFNLAPLFFSGYSFGYERKVAACHWVYLQSTFYERVRTSSMRDADLRKVKGWELGLYHEYDYYTDAQKGYKLYFAYGGNYTDFSVLERVAGDKTSFQKVGIDFNLGVKKSFLSIFYVDCSLGLGQKWVLNKQIISSEASVDNAYQKNMFDYAFSGQVALFNVKLGIVF